MIYVAHIKHVRSRRFIATIQILFSRNLKKTSVKTRLPKFRFLKTTTQSTRYPQFTITELSTSQKHYFNSTTRHFQLTITQDYAMFQLYNTMSSFQALLSNHNDATKQVTSLLNKILQRYSTTTINEVQPLPTEDVIFARSRAKGL